MDPLRMMELGVDGTFKRRLKPDAAQNVPLAHAKLDVYAP
jgi:hypothetical protein